MFDLLRETEKRLLDVSALLTVVKYVDDEELTLEKERLYQIAEDMVDEITNKVTGKLLQEQRQRDTKLPVMPFD